MIFGQAIFYSTKADDQKINKKLFRFFKGDWPLVPFITSFQSYFHKFIVLI